MNDDGVPFRERNPVDRSGRSASPSSSLLILAAFKRRRPAADRRRRHLLRRRSPRPAASRPTTRSASPASGSARSTSVDARRRPRQGHLPGRRPAPTSATDTRRRDQGQDAARRDVPRASSRPAPASSTEGTEIPVARTSSPYDVVRRLLGPRRDLRADRHRPARRVAHHAGRPDPQHPRGVPRRPRRRLAALRQRRRPRRADQHAAARTSTRVSGVLDARDQDIVGLMQDSDVLFRALVERRQAVHNLLVSTSTLSERADRAGPAEPRRPQARADPPRAAWSRC